ncbi:uncharacterized protein LOC107367607 [Tetranychus urticae]|uniref:uncharacterized protein LOC107367607 n=1 Tax=Tetranychus urticae TaxID=32264 RepID=UPI00077BFD09|nr:uncharacterized protein LOC107367607 [Tetranychus urticae]
MFLILSTLLLPTLISPINGDSQIGINSSTMKLSQNSTGNKFINDHGMNRQQGHHLHKRQNSDYKVKRNSDSSKSVFSDKQHLYYVNNAVNSNNYETANFHVNRRGNEFQSYNNMGEMVIDKSSYDPSGYHKLTTHDPSFDDNIKRNITIPQGGTAFLQCKINHLGDRAVSWVRQKDLHILTSGRDTYTSDSRFRSINLPNSNEWTLEIRDTRLSDSGIYECQLSTDPKMSTSVYLSVIALKTVITPRSQFVLEKRCQH